ncbi:chalcone isomerase family protein [Paraburkholderia flava]|uniref:chalcone isomerase family protein n=1 Tax=Paraburkholderia flava TaxID=2547393 RepID=UPI00105C5630|nr:chalcone isomerase family protein [Paraburkholderia flava]
MRALALVLAFVLTGWCYSSAWAGCKDDLGTANELGDGSFCVLGFCLYNAQLWSSAATLSSESPFALVIEYRRSFTKTRLADTGLAEMERLAATPLSASIRDRWRADMLTAFVDVQSGDTLCGAFMPGRGVRFYANDRLTAQIDDVAFARAFFAIWLDPRTRAPQLRRHLLGAAAANDAFR